MDIETMAMLTWAMEHPYLYTLIKIKPPIIAIAIYVLIKIACMVVKKK